MKLGANKALRFRDWKISTKIIFLSCAVIGLLGSMVMFYVLPKVEQKIWDDKVVATRNAVDIAFAVVTEQEALVQKGNYDRAEGQRRAIQTIQSLRYAGNEYFWINDSHPTMIMHPMKPELNGKDLTDNKDPNGKRFFVEMASVCREKGEGLVEYMWPKGAATQPDPKISYVKLFKPWGWIVGSGIYVDDVQAEISSLRWALVLGLLISALFSVGCGIFVGRRITQPLKAVIAQMDSADLNTRLESDREDEIGALERSFDRFVASLKQTMLQVAEAASAVASASSEISSSTEQMAAGSQEQTSQAGEVASAVEEMTKTIVENSRNAGNTAETARQAKAAAEEGGRVVEKTVDGMKRIADVVRKSAETVQGLGKSSTQIGEIIGVIDDIADQTNLLALNAAIEAARAGDQGRGFAVVADEVRRLAERTTTATKEIATMIRTIQKDTAGAVTSMGEGTKHVDEGIRLADQAGVSLSQIVEVSQKVTDMVAQIAAASKQQSSASEQILKNVEAISSVTAETAQGTQQIARAAEDLNQLTEGLQQLVSKFSVSSTEKTVKQSSSHYQSTSRSDQTRSTLAVRENGKLVPHMATSSH